MRQEVLALIDPGEGQESAVVIDDFQERKEFWPAGKPAMRRSIVLPELADLLDLPAAHGPSRRFVFGVGSQALSERPTAHGGAIQLASMATMHLRGGKAVGSRRARLEELAQQRADFLWPSRPLVTTGATRLPGPLPAGGAGAQIIRVEDVEAAAAQSQFAPGVSGGNKFAAKPRQNITDKGCGMPSLQLLVCFSSRRK